jgi:hypothetical protein
MADLKISALTAATTPLAGTEVLPIVQGGVTTKVAVSDLTAGRAVTATSVNKLTITAPATASTLTIADGKTLAVNDNATLGTGGLTLGNSGGFTAAASKVLTANNTLTLAGTDATTQTFPTTSATIARTDAAQTFTGDQTFVNITTTGNTVLGDASTDTLNVGNGDLIKNASGNLLVGQTSGVGANGGKMEIYVADNFNSAPNLVLNVGTNNTGGIYLYFTNAAGTKIGSVTQASSSGVLYNVTSDKRLKNDLGVVSNTNVIANTVIHDFAWKEDGIKERGVFAQEAVNVLPSAVCVGDNNEEVTNPWAVDYSKYVPDIIVELQSLRARVAELEAKLQHSPTGKK